MRLLIIMLICSALAGQEKVEQIRFTNMGMLGTHGEFTVEVHQDDLRVLLDTTQATHLCWSTNPNVLFFKIQEDGYAIQLKGKGKARWFLFEARYKDSTPTPNDGVENPTRTWDIIVR